MNNIQPGVESFKDLYENNIRSQLETSTSKGGYGITNTDLLTFLTQLTKTFGLNYSEFSPYINGNYAVFMEHGTWFKMLQDYSENLNKAPSQVKDYISSMNSEKLNMKLNKYPLFGKKFNSLLQFSQTITDISLPEPNKEYMAISTRQKNSFVNTRDFVGSDFNMNFIDNKDLAIFKYIEAWHKSIDLIREGLFFNHQTDIGRNYFDNLIKEDYLIENPYCNTVWIALMDSKGIDLRGIIALFGVLPMNLPLKSLIGDRGNPKITSYNLNFKFMDMQYVFVDGWDKLQKTTNMDKRNLGKKFFKFLAYSNSDNNTTTI